MKFLIANFYEYATYNLEYENYTEVKLPSMCHS